MRRPSWQPDCIGYAPCGNPTSLATPILAARLLLWRRPSWQPDFFVGDALCGNPTSMFVTPLMAIQLLCWLRPLWQPNLFLCIIPRGNPIPFLSFVGHPSLHLDFFIGDTPCSNPISLLATPLMATQLLFFVGNAPYGNPTSLLATKIKH